MIQSADSTWSDVTDDAAAVQYTYFSGWSDVLHSFASLEDDRLVHAIRRAFSIGPTCFHRYSHQLQFQELTQSLLRTTEDNVLHLSVLLLMCSCSRTAHLRSLVALKVAEQYQHAPDWVAYTYDVCIQLQAGKIKGLVRFLTAQNAALLVSLLIYYWLSRTVNWRERVFQRQLIDHGHLSYWEKRLGWLVLALSAER